MPRSLRTFVLNAIAGICLLLVGFGAGWFSATRLGGMPLTANVAAWFGPGAEANRSSPEQLRMQFGLFWEVWNLVENEFYTRTPLDRQKMIRGAIGGMLAALDDQYTVYQEPDLAAQTNEHMQGRQAGIGTYLRITDGRAFLWKPIKGGPAISAGLKQDDELLMIDGEAVGPLIAGLDINEAAVKVAAKIRGEPGTQVTLSLRRESEKRTFTITLTRAEIVIPSVDSQMFDTGVAYLKINEFKSNTTSEFDEAMRSLLARRPKGFVLDLRNNPGGYLQNAQDVLGRFYNGVALYEEDRAGALKELRTNLGPGDARAYETPLVVLVNANSASASEIVAGALRDKRPGAMLLGERTYGKGSVQNIHPLSDGGNARVTFAHWLTPNQGEIHKTGLTPQFLVPYAEDEKSAVPCVADRQPAPGKTTCYDNQLFWATRLLTSGERPPVVSEATKP
jgi:carboxyl-terminal processing protease